jgi:hypothetical protein
MLVQFALSSTALGIVLITLIFVVSYFFKPNIFRDRLNAPPPVPGLVHHPSRVGVSLSITFTLRELYTRTITTNNM